MQHVADLRPGSRRGAFILAVFTFLFALSLYQIGIREQYVWIDEFLTSRAVQLPWLDLIENRIAAGHFPTYWLLIKSLGIAADDYVAMRVVSAVFMAAAVGVLSGGIYRYLDFRAALLAAFLLSMAPDHAFWAQQARPYGLALFGVSISLVAMLALFARPGQRETGLGSPGIWLNLGLVLATVSLTTTLLVAMLLAITPILAFGRTGGRRTMAVWFRGLLPFGIVLVIALILVAIPSVMARSDGFWVEEYHPMSPRALASMAQDLLFAPAATWSAAALGLTEFIFRILFWPVAPVLFVLALYAALSLGERVLLLPIIMVACLHPAILLGVSFHSSLLLDRYFLPALGPWLVLATLGLVVFSDRGARGPAVAVGLFLASSLGIVTFGVLRSPNDHIHTDYAVLEQRLASFGIASEDTFLDEHWQGEALQEALVHNTDLPARNFAGIQSDLIRLASGIAEGRPTLLLYAEARRIAVFEGLPARPVCIEKFGYYQIAVFGIAEDIECRM